MFTKNPVQCLSRCLGVFLVGWLGSGLVLADDCACPDLTNADITIEAVNQNKFCAFVREDGTVGSAYVGPPQPNNEIHVLTCHHGVFSDRSECFITSIPTWRENGVGITPSIGKWGQYNISEGSTYTELPYNLAAVNRQDETLAGNNYTCLLVLLGSNGLDCGSLIESAPPVTFTPNITALTSPSDLLVTTLANRIQVQWQRDETACDDPLCPERRQHLNLDGQEISLLNTIRSVVLPDPDNQLQDEQKIIRLQVTCDRNTLPRSTKDGRRHTVYDSTPVTAPFSATIRLNASNSTEVIATHARWQAEPYTHIDKAVAGCTLRQLPSLNNGTETTIIMPELRLAISHNETELPECQTLYNGSAFVASASLKAFEGVNITRLSCQYRNENGDWGNTLNNTFVVMGNDSVCLFPTPDIEAGTEPDDSSRTQASTAVIAAALAVLMANLL